jgi:hypothetical protein
MEHNELLNRYKSLREKGVGEHEAMEAIGIGELLNPENHDKSVTAKDLKIALLEFAKEYKLDLVNIKLKFILWALGAILAFMLSGFGIVFKMLFDISVKLPK